MLRNQRVGGAAVAAVAIGASPSTAAAHVTVTPRRDHPRWTFAVTTATLATPLESDDRKVTEAVSKITWTMDSIGDQVFQT